MIKTIKIQFHFGSTEKYACTEKKGLVSRNADMLSRLNSTWVKGEAERLFGNKIEQDTKSYYILINAGELEKGVRMDMFCLIM